MGAAGVAIFVLAPLALYALLVGTISTGIATWIVGTLRPLLLMLLISPTVVAGHGIAIAPLTLALGAGIFTDSPYIDSLLPQYFLQWLVNALLAFLFECGLAAWRRRQQRRAPGSRFSPTRTPPRPREPA